MRTYRGHTFTGFKVLALEKLKLSDKYEFGAPTGSYASPSGLWSIWQQQPVGCVGTYE